MPQKLFFQDGFVRGEFDLQKRHYSIKDIIRTDFILENVYSYLIRDHYNFDPIRAMNKKEKEIFEAIKELLDSFRASYAYPVKILCAEIDSIHEDIVGSVLLGVSNELFSEGITWSRIIAFFVFVGELSIMCISKKLPLSIVDVIYECSSRLVKEKLETWIEDHGGWEGSIVVQ